jgi:hypothetical protein
LQEVVQVFVVLEGAAAAGGQFCSRDVVQQVCFVCACSITELSQNWRPAVAT